MYRYRLSPPTHEHILWVVKKIRNVYRECEKKLFFFSTIAYHYHSKFLQCTCPPKKKFFFERIKSEYFLSSFLVLSKSIGEKIEFLNSTRGAILNMILRFTLGILSIWSRALITEVGKRQTVWIEKKKFKARVVTQEFVTWNIFQNSCCEIKW